MWHVKDCVEKIQFCFSYLIVSVGWERLSSVEAKKQRSGLSSYHEFSPCNHTTNILKEKDNKLITIRSGLEDGLLCNPSTNTHTMDIFQNIPASVLMIINTSRVPRLGVTLCSSILARVSGLEAKVLFIMSRLLCTGAAFLIKSRRISLSNIGRCDHCLSLQLNENMFIFGPRFI